MRPLTELSAADIATALGVDDVLVFELHGDRARLRGGTGRGETWAGTVDVALADEPLLARAVADGRVVRAEGDATRIVGPYWSGHAAVAPVGDHVVVVGGAGPIRTSSAELVRRGAEAVAVVGEVPASRLLADELELAHAVRQLSELPSSSLPETGRHIAAVAADALSCEIGAVLLRRGGTTEVHGAGSAWARMADDDQLCAALHDLADRVADGPIVEQDLAAVGRSGLRIVSCYALGIGRTEPLGALIVGHTEDRPRGFTLLCQRVGRALADAAESALRAAIAHELLTIERDRFALEARTDPMTGLGNRVTWEATLAMEQARAERARRPLVLLAVDVDGLKATNDAFGHRVGDELLIGAADVLRTAVRAGDVIARIGGDEFGVLLADADATAADAIRRRVDAGCASWQGTRPEARLRLSIGSAVPGPHETLGEAFGRADAAMYEDRRRSATPGA